MVGLDREVGIWKVADSAGEHELRIGWPGGPINERPEIRREVVVLYKDACKKLGVTPREEHGAGQTANAHGGAHQHAAGHPHGGGHPGGHPHAKPEDEGTFSYAIRTATWGDHGDSEGSGVMEDIMRKRSTIEEYTSLVVQHYFMYEALEEASKQLAADPRYAALHPAALLRADALVEDLELLVGADWRDRIAPLAATKAYADRIREVAAEGWTEGLIAHHYTRYLGDLSGGQMIARQAKAQFEFGEAGVSFYDFTELGSIADFKAMYREALDQLGETLDEAERHRVIEEVREAYRFNTEVFNDMRCNQQLVAH